MSWKNNPRIADFWEHDPNTEKVICNLCPRHCTLKEGQSGFCGVRGNRGGKLYTFNYGKMVRPTIETIETEAVYHYSPGAKILSLGNIGCMMNCKFCQNWETSQVKYVKDRDVYKYSPRQIIDLAKSNQVDFISWTYNDPVVWHEFVLDTAKLAKKEGIKNLYKSALYIETEPLKELIDLMDIFSISLKSMSSEFYHKYTKGKLDPVLKGIKNIYESGKHLELSRLVVTGLNDTEFETEETVNWILNNLDSQIPLHFVAYHPAYRYLDEPRTPLPTLIKARNYAIENGIEYCYIGNIYAPNVSNTLCKKCNTKLVDRFGLNVKVVGLDAKGVCKNCGTQSTIKTILNNKEKSSSKALFQTFVAKQNLTFNWNSENNSLHCDIVEKPPKGLIARITRYPSNEVEYLEINGIERFALSKSSNNETGVKISFNNLVKVNILPLLDRAHFPVFNQTQE